ncbi:hypothetical protein VTN00DRAFT_5320 [Thermoascus crustaceus]|uniref:uncharacterized protein n=1 Tax=Thermoascus crustaceus TaxID=5088 RepID=UPI003742D368
MFCSSLRNRPVWRVLGPILTSGPEMSLRESRLETHDFVFEIPSSRRQQQLRVILLTPSSQPPNGQDTTTRLEQFSTSTGGRGIAIAFLLSEEAFTSASGRCILDGLVDAQALLLDTLPISIPIIPIQDSAAFLPSMQEYINGLANTPQPNPSPSLPTSLLAHTTSAPYHLLSETDTNILSDLFPSLPALSRAVRTRKGRALVMDHFDAETARRILEFWEGDQGP